MTTKQRGAIVIGIVVSVLVASAVVAAASPGRNPQPPGRKPRPAAPAATTSTTAPAASLDGEAAVTITGGHETDPVDHGRPVVLIAAALDVPTEVFRTAFSGVTPAGHGSGGPTEAEARANKQALLSVLAPHGVTNERLDEVSNFYRYVPGPGSLWTHRDATATATIVDGAITDVTITDPGAGYSSPPTVTVAGHPLTATVAYGTDLPTNGGITAIVPS